MPSSNPSSPLLLRPEDDDGEEEEEEDSDYDSEEYEEDEGGEGDEEEYIPLVRRSARNPRPPPPNSPRPILIEEEDEEDNPGEDEEDDGAVVEVERDGGSDSGPKKPDSEAHVGDAGGDEPDTFTCSICMEPWTSVGPHRTCCLPCGHVYGRSCIDRWIRQGGSESKCPQCNKKCKLSEVRNLYAPRVVVVDEDLQKELVSLRSENELLKMRVRHCSISIKRFDSIVNVLNNSSLLEEVRMLKVTNTILYILVARTCSLMNRAEHGDGDGMRLVVVIDLCEFREGENANKRQMEIEAYDKQRKARLEYVPSGGAHMKLFEDSGKDVNLLCSFPTFACLQDEFGVDGARVFDIDASNEILIVARRPLTMAGAHMLTKVPAWSCSWDANCPHHVYAGLQNGMLMVFDLRQTVGPVMSTSGLTSHPIHSIQSVVDDGLQSSFSGNRTLLTASSIGPCQWNVGGGDESLALAFWGLWVHEDNGEGKREIALSTSRPGGLVGYPQSDNLLRMEKKLCLEGDEKCTRFPRNDIVASFRPKVQIPSDGLSSQASLSASPIASRELTISSSPNSRPTVLGSHVFVKRVGGNSYQSIGATPSNVSEVRFLKSAIISFDDDYSLFAFGDEATHGVCLRVLPSFGIIEHLKPHPNPILDLKYTCSGGLGEGCAESVVEKPMLHGDFYLKETGLLW
ncbi:hypothetical protein ACLOJK_015866 [Asimina triloba]